MSNRQIERGFNTQPPEGGWMILRILSSDIIEFQHTAARRRLAGFVRHRRMPAIVSTHSRPKAAGLCAKKTHTASAFQHTAARRRLAAKAEGIR